MADQPPLADPQFKQEVIGLYGRAAPLYDQVGTRHFSYHARRLVEQLDLPAGAHVLDVATGRGALLFAAAQRVGPQGRVLGVDLAPAMVDLTSAEIRRRGLAHAEVRLMDADDLSFPDHSFDAILCGFALHFLDYPRLLPRFRRFLKPGGLIATTHPYVPTGDSENLARWQWLFDLTRDLFPPGFSPPPAWIAPRRLNAPDRIEAALRDAGFQNISISREETTLYFADEEDWWQWEWSQGSRFWLEGMSPDALSKFKAVSMQHLRQMKGPHGIPMRDAALYALARTAAS